MRYKYTSIFLLVTVPIALCVRIPPNPCPHIFQYYKDLQGKIYGEAVVPYDNATYMEFTVNASFLGKFRKPNLKLEMVTQLNELNDYTRNVIYSIYFPFMDVIPKITGIHYNNVEYCSGPGEPVIPGEPGITNVWNLVSFKFSRRSTGFYKPDYNPDTFETDIPVKKPNERPTPPRPTPPRPTPSRPTQPWPTPQWTQATPQWPQATPPWTQATPPVQQWPTFPTDDNGLATKLPQTPPKASVPEPDPVDQGLIDTLFTKPPVFNSTPTPATFTLPTVTENGDGFKCGVPSNDPPSNSIVPFILGATDTDIGQYPWLVAFFTKKGSKYDYKCSANLISDKHVLTAARCLQYYKIRVVQTEEIFLIMGTNSLSNWNNDAVTRRARRVDVHPDFQENPKSAHGDLALITMDRAVQFSKVLSPVCLWTGSTDLYPLTNKMGVIAGFGQDENSQTDGLTHVVRAKRADMPIVSQRECLISPQGFNEVTSDRTFCTKSTGDTPRGPCIGDSGAGFFILVEGAYHIRGIASAVSVSNGTCDLSNKYSVFCDVAKFSDWITSNMI